MLLEEIMTKVIIAKNKIDCEHLLGQFLDESHFDTLIEADTDCYLHSQDESNTVRVNRNTLIARTIGEVSSVINLEHCANLARCHGVATSKIRNKRIKSIRHIKLPSKTPLQ